MLRAAGIGAEYAGCPSPRFARLASLGRFRSARSGPTLAGHEPRQRVGGGRLRRGPPLSRLVQIVSLAGRARLVLA